MSVTTFLNDVSPAVRLLLALVVTVGITLLAVWLLHSRCLALAALDVPPDDDEAEDGDSAATTAKAPRPLPARDLAGRVLALTGVGFVFLFTFTFANFWNNAQAATTAVQNEEWAYARALASAEALPSSPETAAIVAALHTYANSVQTDEWNLMRNADARGASHVHAKAGDNIATAVLAASNSDAAKSPAWSAMESAISDMISDGSDRIMQLPGPSAPAVIFLIFVLGISNLAITAAFQPTRLQPNLVLMGLMATITGLLLFLVVEASNIYIGGGSLPIPTFGAS